MKRKISSCELLMGDETVIQKGLWRVRSMCFAFAASEVTTGFTAFSVGLEMTSV